MNKLLCKVCVCAIVGIFCLQFFAWHHIRKFSKNFKIFKSNPRVESSALKNGSSEDSQTVVLMWTQYYSDSDESLLKNVQFGTTWRPGCCSEPVCCTGADILVTRNRTLLQNATAIVFYDYNLNSSDLPLFRHPGQVWILFSKESPMYSPGLTEYASLFNWTMNYRHDSDIWSPYGYKVPLEKSLSKNGPIIMPGGIPLDQWIAGKSKPIGAAISNCETRSMREKLTKSLVNSKLSMDVYGACGQLEMCSRLDPSCNLTEAWRNVSASYKFYFAAENSLCPDYISEKFWRTLQVGMVPLVYGGANYTAVAPPNSFVDVSQFESVSELVEYLTMLVENSDEYAKYFEWRRNFEVKLTDGWHGWCTLCDKAKEYRKYPSYFPKTWYNDLDAFWRKKKVSNDFESICMEPPAIVQRLN